jgi:signal transduction histidine kinase
MTTAALLVLAVATGLTGAFTACRMLRARWIEEMSKPIHELRGALGALQLGLRAMERTGRSRSDLEGCIDALRMPLDRATLAVADVDACRQGRPGIRARGAERFELASIVLQSARAWSRLAPSYHSRFRIDWRAGPVHVRADAGRLKQALDNLMANALEHGSGRVLVEGGVRAGRVRISISDGGAGPPRLRSKRLTLGAPSPRGYGLSIAREVVEAHGGKLEIEAGGNGAAVVIDLPVDGQLDASAHARHRQRLSSIAAPRPDSRAPNAA